MITGIDRESITRELIRERLPEYWGQYFSYERDTELCELTKNEFLKEIEKQRIKDRPYIDSKILISKILTNFGAKHIFHRHFNERHPELHREQVLGMQLYKILVEDKKDTWIFHKTTHDGHEYSNATYFISK
jgi:hypothetical protein